MKQVFNQVGPYGFKLDDVLDKDGNIDGQKLLREQRKLCLLIVLSEESPTEQEKAEYFNFFLNASGLRASELGVFGIEPTEVSLWRSGQVAISNISWELIRGVFYRFFKNNKLTTFSQLIEGQDIHKLIEAILKESELKQAT